jgi:hypothetical protein
MKPEIPEDNSIDAFYEQGTRQIEKYNQLIEQEAIRVHKVFAQTEDGQELLRFWREQLMMLPTAMPHSTAYEVGIAEGFKEFIRNIIRQIGVIESQHSGE